MGAVAVAQDRGHSTVLPEHFLVAALTDDLVAAALHRAGGSAAAAIDACIERLDSVVAASDGRRLALCAPLERALAGAVREDRLISLSAVLAQLKAVSGALLPRAAFEVGAADATPASSGYRERGTSHHIVLWNNPRTKMEHVVQILTELLGIDRTRALCFMWRIHCVGAARVGEWPTREALELAERARALSAEIGHPLEVTASDSFKEPEQSLVARWKRRARYADLLSTLGRGRRTKRHRAG